MRCGLYEKSTKATSNETANNHTFLTAVSTRPRPPRELVENTADAFEETGHRHFQPAPDLAEWLQATFIRRGGLLRNRDHEHLDEATFGVLWTDVLNMRHQIGILATAEKFFPQGNKWSKGRQEQQLMEWFGMMPDFILTFYAPICDRLGDAEWCAVCEHELYHCAQAPDKEGKPKFDLKGNPVFALRGHDVGVVRRYGMKASGPGVEAMGAAARSTPTVAVADIEFACGTCVAQVASARGENVAGVLLSGCEQNAGQCGTKRRNAYPCRQDACRQAQQGFQGQTAPESRFKKGPRIPHCSAPYFSVKRGGDGRIQSISK